MVSYRQLRKQLIDGEELLRSLRSRAVPGSPATDGMPHASGTSDKVGSLAIAIVDLEARLPVLKAPAALHNITLCPEPGRILLS